MKKEKEKKKKGSGWWLLHRELCKHLTPPILIVAAGSECTTLDLPTLSSTFNHPNPPYPQFTLFMTRFHPTCFPPSPVWVKSTPRSFRVWWRVAVEGNGTSYFPTLMSYSFTLMPQTATDIHMESMMMFAMLNQPPSPIMALLYYNV